MNSGRESSLSSSRTSPRPTMCRPALYLALTKYLPGLRPKSRNSPRSFVGTRAYGDSLRQILQVLKLYHRGFYRLASREFHYDPRNRAFVGSGSCYGRAARSRLRGGNACKEEGEEAEDKELHGHSHVA